MHSIGLDFGTESVRALVVDLKGNEVGSSVSRYSHSQIIDSLPSGEPLPPLFALQDPDDWLSSSESAVREALAIADGDADSVIGIGVDFTSCTMLPTHADGRPLCKTAEFSHRPHAWPKLWKHHGAQRQADRITELARMRKEPFLQRYGDTIGLEWFFPKVLEVLEDDCEVFDAAEIWLEAGDWFVWQLTGGESESLPRSTCQAGYKAMWSAEHGYPSEEFLSAVHPRLAEVVSHKMPGRLLAPGTNVGGLSPAMAERFGLLTGTSVSAAIIDAHAGVPGAGVATDGTLVMVMGTSSCHMLNSLQDGFIPGVAGVVRDGILPGYYGYETGQAAVGDAFDWLRVLLGHKDHSVLASEAVKLPPGADGVTCLDWMNGCRTPLMDGSLSGAFAGLKLSTKPAQLYRALLEASAFGMRWIVESLGEGGIAVKQYVATGGLPHHNPQLMQIYADVLGEAISIHPSKYGAALGAAVLGTLAAGEEKSGFSTAQQAIESMAAPRKDDPLRQPIVVEPSRQNRELYELAYLRYRELAHKIQEKENP